MRSGKFVTRVFTSRVSPLQETDNNGDRSSFLVNWTCPRFPPRNKRHFSRAAFFSVSVSLRSSCAVSMTAECVRQRPFDTQRSRCTSTCVNSGRCGRIASVWEFVPKDLEDECPRLAFPSGLPPTRGAGRHRWYLEVIHAAAIVWRSSLCT